MAKFDKLSGFLTLPHPEKENRDLKFRIQDFPERGLTLLEHADDSGAWAPTRMATEEEIALWRSLHDTGNAKVTHPQEGRGAAKPGERSDPAQSPPTPTPDTGGPA